MLIFVTYDDIINAGLRSYGHSSGKELSINGRWSILLPKGGVANGTICIYHFDIDICNRLHIGNKKEINRLTST